MPQGTCSIEGCAKPSKSRGWCGKHYMRWERHGDPLSVLTPHWSHTAEERFWPKVNKNGPIPAYCPELGPCWLWTGHIAKGSKGYARLGWLGRQQLAHRVAYELVIGPIPEGLTLDHLCRVRHCVNPRHLAAITNRENILRGESPSAKWAGRTHCGKGHEFTPENTYTRPNGEGRICRTCMRAYQRARWVPRSQRD
jgi:hypothetical protein